MKKQIEILVAFSLFATGLFAQKDLLVGLYENLPFKMEQISTYSYPDNKISITDFGAVSDGVTDNASAFEKAINAISEKGGGTVIVPEGLWLTGPIQFKSNINLHLESGALIQFSSDKSKYPLIKTSFEGFDTRRCLSPISGNNLKNIAITGDGVIDGAGDAWRAVNKRKMTESQWKDLVKSGGVLDEKGKTWFPSESYKKGFELSVDQNVPKVETEAEWQEIRDYLRPVMLSFVSCENVLLEGVTFQNSPAWCLHPLMCTNVQIIDVNVRNPWYAQNGDALDLESCKNVVVYNSTFDAGDDAICIKSGKNEDGRRRGMPCENIIVNKCIVYHGHGGFVVGSEMSGGVKNISVDNCLFLGTDAGLRFKTNRERGGVVENIYISNINMINIKKDAIIFNMYYWQKNAIKEWMPVTDGTPTFKDIYIKNVCCNGADRAMFFNGLPEMMVQNIHLENISISADNGAELSDCDGIIMKDVLVNPRKGPILKMNNVLNVAVDNFSSSNSDNDEIKIDGEQTKNISMKNMKINKEQVVSTVKVKGF